MARRAVKSSDERAPAAPGTPPVAATETPAPAETGAVQGAAEAAPAQDAHARKAPAAGAPAQETPETQAAAQAEPEKQAAAPAQEAPEKEQREKVTTVSAARARREAAREAAAKEAAERAEREKLLAAKLESLPVRSGCYLFYDKDRACLYVGKAKSLRSRVRSYFQEHSGDERYFIPILRRLVADLETVVTATEKEAAVLENELIKKNKPRFNVKLRDDKDFLCLRLDPKKEWPLLETVRRPDEDGARYFGPYHSATSARRTLHLVNKHFQLRTCSDADFATRRRPCLQYQIKRCLAPCVYEVDRGYYSEMVRSVTLFLEGRHDELTGEITQHMRDAARHMEFERAAIYRDQLKAIEAIREEQRVVAIKDVDQDVLGLYREGSLVELELLIVRSGHVKDTISFSLKGVEVPDEEVLSGFFADYYETVVDPLAIPDEILVPTLPDGVEGVAEWLTERRGKKVVILRPQRGPRVDLLQMSADNAHHSFREKQRAGDDIEARLEELRDRLRLPSLPHRIECCDISHLGGGDTVGSIVSLLDGQPDKKRYKSYNVKSVSDGDDYLAMYEVLARRFRRGKTAQEAVELPPPPEVEEAESEEAESEEAESLDGEEAEWMEGEESEPADEPPMPKAEPEKAEPAAAAKAAPTGKERKDGDWELPDLFVVDGGRGQLQVALSAARDLGLHGLPIVGLAKERENALGDKVVDRVYLPGQKNGIPLRPGSTALFFLARARDEAHRFANFARKRLGKRARLRSEIDDIPGLGSAKKTLLRELGSMAAVRAATDEQILAVKGITKRHLTALRKVIAAPEPAEPEPS
jgi:excinuclease ABC subunit C